MFENLLYQSTSKLLIEDIKKNQVNTNKKIISLNNINNINKSNLKTHKNAIVKAEKNITNVANNLDSFINDVSVLFLFVILKA